MTEKKEFNYAEYEEAWLPRVNAVTTLKEFKAIRAELKKELDDAITERAALQIAIEADKNYRTLKQAADDAETAYYDSETIFAKTHPRPSKDITFDETLVPDNASDDDYRRIETAFYNAIDKTWTQALNKYADDLEHKRHAAVTTAENYLHRTYPADDTLQRKIYYLANLQKLRVHFTYSKLYAALKSKQLQLTQPKPANKLTQSELEKAIQTAQNAAKKEVE